MLLLSAAGTIDARWNKWGRPTRRQAGFNLGKPTTCNLSPSTFDSRLYSDSVTNHEPPVTNYD